jgi:hypothetical protein
MRPRIPLSACMAAIGLVAADLAVLRYATAPWDSGQPLRQPLLNILPMTNALAIAGWSLAGGRGRPRRFAAGFFVGGLAALLLHAGYDWADPRAMWATCDWLANHCPRLSPVLGEWLTTYTVPNRGSYFRLYPAFAFVICLPEFVTALACAAAVRAWSPGRRAPEASSRGSPA